MMTYDVRVRCQDRETTLEVETLEDLVEKASWFAIETAVKDAPGVPTILEITRRRCQAVSGSLEMAEFDAIWLEQRGDGPDAPWRQPSSAWLTEELVDDAHSAFSEAYRQEFPAGGDAGDHHNATREGLVAALLLAHGRSSAPEGKQPSPALGQKDAPA